MSPTWVGVRADHETVSPPELGISSNTKLPNREPRFRRFGVISLVSKAVPALPSISYNGIGMIVITVIILEQAHGGKMSRFVAPYW